MMKNFLKVASFIFLAFPLLILAACSIHERNQEDSIIREDIIINSSDNDTREEQIQNSSPDMPISDLKNSSVIPLPLPEESDNINSTEQTLLQPSDDTLETNPPKETESTVETEQLPETDILITSQGKLTIIKQPCKVIPPPVFRVFAKPGSFSAKKNATYMYHIPNISRIVYENERTEVTANFMHSCNTRIDIFDARNIGTALVLKHFPYTLPSYDLKRGFKDCVCLDTITYIWESTTKNTAVEFVTLGLRSYTHICIQGCEPQRDLECCRTYSSNFTYLDDNDWYQINEKGGCTTEAPGVERTAFPLEECKNYMVCCKSGSPFSMSGFYGAFWEDEERCPPPPSTGSGKLTSEDRVSWDYCYP
jgi:hypothetical protein